MVTITLLQIIRELEGQHNVERQPSQHIPRDEPEELRTPCPFATIVSYESKKLFQCDYKKKCDEQMEIGYKKYCQKELEK